MVGSFFEDLGYNVVYREVDAADFSDQIARARLSAGIEVWSGSYQRQYDRALRRGMVDAGSHVAVQMEGWWYPKWAEERCPRLPDYRALNACKEVFSEGSPTGRPQIVAGPRDWRKFDAERAEALGIEFDVVTVSQARELWNAIDAAVRRRTPILIYNWTPNFSEALWPGRYVQLPPWSRLCETDPNVGRAAAYDCAHVPMLPIKKAASYDMEAKWPEAFKLLTELCFSSPQLSQMAKLRDIDGYNEAQAAQIWISENEAIWKDWQRCRRIFTKADGTERTMCIQPASLKFHVKGDRASQSARTAARTRAIRHPHLMPVWDADRAAPRSVNLATVSRIAVDGHVHHYPN